jgi:hypothetical protein
MKLNTILLFVLVTSLFSCKSTKITVPVDFTNYEVKALNQGTEGTVLMKVYSYGYTVDNAIQRAKMDAIHAVLFKGIPGSNVSRPLVKKGRAAHKDYFDTFFGLYKVKGGKRKMIDPLDINEIFNAPYKQYVQISNDGSVDPSDRLRIGNKYKVGVVISVNLRELREKMQKDHIIRSLNTGF